MRPRNMTAAGESDASKRRDGDSVGKMDTSFGGDANVESNIRTEDEVAEERNVCSLEDSVDGMGEEDEMETRCGIGSWRPSWLQWFARAEVYAITHSMLSFVITSDAMYFVGTLSTVEKHLKIPSRTTGFMHSSFEIGSLVAMPILGYAARHLSPMRLVCSGTMLTGLACLIFTLPYLIFGAGSDAGTRAGVSENSLLGNTTEANTSLLQEKSQQGTISQNCDDDDDDNDFDFYSSSWPVIIFCVANVMVGIGNSAHYTVGLAYLDSNSSKNKSPILLAATSFVQMFGSTLGFAVAAMALRFYVDPTLTPSFNDSDPRWIGAWWLGWPLMSALTVTVGCLAALFPRRLPQAALRRKQVLAATGAEPHGDGATPSVRDLRFTILRLLKNKILVFNTCSTICLMFGYSSYWSFLPKYIETQFRKSASEANIITGTMSQIFAGAGMMAAAIFITRFKPGPRKIAAWNVVTELVDVMGHFSWAFLGCSVRNVYGVTDGSGIFTATCDSSIVCGNDTQISPVCDQYTDTTFYSPCFAGCNTSYTSSNGTKMFSECACILNGMATDGACKTDCSGTFMAFMAWKCILNFLQASGHSGNFLLAFRCVDDRDKSLSIALTQIALSIIVFFPAPTIYGALLDSTCLTWEKNCGNVGNCLLYDNQMMRYVLNFTATGCLIIGVVFDIGVWVYSSGLKVYDEDDIKDINDCPKESVSHVHEVGV